MTAEPCRRGTTNRNIRGNTKDRKRRREWIVATFAADVHILELTWPGGATTRIYPTDRAMEAAWLAVDDAEGTVEQLATCRCYRCATLLTVDTVTIDRILPGVEGGTYGTPLRDERDGRTNCRPACGDCQSEVGGALGAARKAAAS